MKILVLLFEVGDWFGGPMLEEGWKGKHQELKFFIGETDSEGTVLVSLAKKEYFFPIAPACASF